MFFKKKPEQSSSDGKQRWQGHVDSVAGGVIAGWAIDKSASTLPVEIVAVANSGKQVMARADRYRADLEEQGIGNGRCGFTLDVSSWIVDDGGIKVRILDTDFVLDSGVISPSQLFLDAKLLSAAIDKGQRWGGWIDAIDRKSVKGWAADLDNLHQRIRVEAVSSTGKKIIKVADRFRGDLKDAGLGDGYHAFEVDLRGWSHADCPFDVTINQGKVRINKHPLDFDIITMASTSAPPAKFRIALEAVATEALSKFEEISSVHPINVLKIHKNTAPWKIETATHKLLQPSEPSFDPEGIISSFLQYESFRNERDRRELEMRGTLQDRLQALMWYIIHYQRVRRADGCRIPISPTQQRALNASLPIAGFSPEISVALFSVARIERPDLVPDGSPQALRSALY